MTPDPTPLPGLDAPAERLPQEGRLAVRCALCGEPLTAAVSRRWGLGSHCRRKLGLTSAPGVGRREVEQDGLWA